MAGSIPSFNIVDRLVDRHVEAGEGGRVALIEGERTRTYAQLQHATRALAARLRAQGVREGTRVALLLEDSLDAMTAMLGVMRAGGVAVLLNPLLDSGAYPPYFASAAPELLLVSPTLSERLREAPGELARGALVQGPTEALLAEPEPAVLPPAATTRLSDAFGLFTSGTTGTPSAVIHRHQDIEVTNEDYGAEILSLSERDITYSPSPLFFAYGLNSIHLALYHGGTAVLPGLDRRPAAILERIERHRPTVFFTVPTLYFLILGKTTGGDLSSLRLCVSAGEPLPPKVAEEWQARFGLPILDGIGTTEVLSTFISNRPGDVRVGATGKPVRGFEVRILDAQGRDVAPGERGILWVRGRTHPSQYLHAPEASRQRFREEGFVTNDIFFVDAEGYYHYCGRHDDMVKVGGQWVSPRDLELTLQEHPAVGECAVVSDEDAWGLNRPHAHVVLREGHVPSEALGEELKAFCRQRLGLQYPHFVSFLEALPRTFTGKVRRFLLRKGPSAPPSLTLDRERFEALVAQGYNQVPLVRGLELGEVRPVDLLRALPPRHRFLLESTRVSQEGRYSLIGARTFLTFRAKGPRCWLNEELHEGEPVATLRALQKRWRGLRLPGMPLFCGGAVGYFAYEANHYFEQLPRHPNDDLGIPDMLFHFVDTFIAVDHQERRVLVVATGDDYVDCARRVDRLEQLVREVASHGPSAAPAPPPLEAPTVSFRSNFTLEAYLRAVEQVQEYIRSGDTYQVNLSQRLEVEQPMPALELYEALSALNPVHFASYFEFEDFEVVSSSPERLVRVEDGWAITRPIAGTRRKGTPEENARFIHELRTSEKERAEHAMLVDLERNDLGRVCTYGTVEVARLMEITEYAHVIHIESEVVGRVAPGVDLLGVLGAVFPGGTITGVPKIRTMEVITELEPNARGLYTGSIGYMSFAGEMDLNIVIRTILLKGGKAYVQVGGGVVIDSNPRQEYKETLNKARSQLLALSARGPREAP